MLKPKHGIIRKNLPYEKEKMSNISHKRKRNDENTSKSNSTPNKKIKSKLTNRGRTCIFVGYSNKHSGEVFRMVNLQTKKIIYTRDVCWLQKKFGEYLLNPKLTQADESTLEDKDNRVKTDEDDISADEPGTIAELMEEEAPTIRRRTRSMGPIMPGPRPGQNL